MTLSDRVKSNIEVILEKVCRQLPNAATTNYASG